MTPGRIEAWSQALLSRHSRRSYDPSPVAPDTLEALEALCATFRPYDDARTVLVRDPGRDAFTGAVGSYGKVSGAPHVLVMIAGEGARSRLHIGYTGEAAVLEATSLGLDTCWVAGFFDRDAARTLVTLEPGETIVALSPVGHARTAPSGSERSLVALAGSHRRKPLRAIARDIGAQWPEWALGAVEAARVAPSAMNRQPWRFRLEEGSLVISMDRASRLSPIPRELDCGIAMLNAEVAARAHGCDGRWEELDHDLDLARWIPTMRTDT